MSPADRYLTLRVPIGLLDLVDRAAQRDGVSRSEWVRQALAAATRPAPAAPKSARVEATADGLVGQPTFRRISAP